MARYGQSPDLIEANIYFVKGYPSKGTAKVVGTYKTNGKSLSVIPCRDELCCGEGWEFDLELHVVLSHQPNHQVLLEHRRRRDGTEFYLAHEPSRKAAIDKDSFTHESIYHLGDEGIEVVFLGGIGHTGERSCALVKVGNDAVMIDCGVNVALVDADVISEAPTAISETNDPEVPTITDNDDVSDEDEVRSTALYPDFDWFNEAEGQEDQIVIHGIAETHGHFDHVGGLGELMRRRYIGQDRPIPPILGTPFTESIVGSYLRDQFPKDRFPDLRFDLRVFTKEPIILVPFKITAIPLPHSIRGAAAIVVEVKGKQIVFTGDFKLQDKSHLDIIDNLNAISEVIREPLLMVMDGTGALRRGITDLDSIVAPGLYSAIKQATSKPRGRALITLFATHFERIRLIKQICNRLELTCACVGRSFGPILQAAEATGITISMQIDNIADADVIIITGCQANEYSVCKQLSEGRTVYGLRLRETDTVIFSSLPIPGRRYQCRMMIEAICARGASVKIDNKYPEVVRSLGRGHYHESGHASIEELGMVVEVTKPYFFIPGHSDPESMLALAEKAVEKGVAFNRVLLPLPTDNKAITLRF